MAPEEIRVKKYERLASMFVNVVGIVTAVAYSIYRLSFAFSPLSSSFSRPTWLILTEISMLTFEIILLVINFESIHRDEDSFDTRAGRAKLGREWGPGYPPIPNAVKKVRSHYWIRYIAIAIMFLRLSFCFRIFGLNEHLIAAIMKNLYQISICSVCYETLARISTFLLKSMYEFYRKLTPTYNDSHRKQALRTFEQSLSKVT